MDTIVGSRLGAYLVEKRLGQGGMATIFLAVQPSTGRRVAIKTLPKASLNDAKAVARFEREAKVLASLQHPHILPLIDYGESGEYKYLVVPFLSHGDLEDRLNRQLGPMDPSEARRILSQLGEALDHAHSQGVIHRDLKPGNVLLDAQGNAMLADFGIAHQLGSDRLTGVGFTVGTPEYMAPEQVNGQAEARSDLYALGVLAFRLLTGSLPYKGATATATLLLQRDSAVPDPLSVYPQLSTTAATFLLKALAKDKTERFQTGSQFAAAVRAALPETSLSAQQATQQVSRPEVLSAPVAARSVATDSGTQPLPTPAGIQPPASPVADPYATTVSGKFGVIDRAMSAAASNPQRPGDSPTAGVTTTPAASPGAPVAGVATMAAQLLGAPQRANAAATPPPTAAPMPTPAPTTTPAPSRRSAGRLSLWAAGAVLLALPAWWWLSPKPTAAPPQIVDAAGSTATPAAGTAAASASPAEPPDSAATPAPRNAAGVPPPPALPAPLPVVYEAFDGAVLSAERWAAIGGLAQRLDGNGLLELTATGDGQWLESRRHGRLLAVAARVWMPAPMAGDRGSISLTVSRDQWWLGCYLSAQRDRGDLRPACQEQGKPVVESDERLQAGWHDLLLEFDPDRRSFSYSVDGRLIGRHVPARLPAAPAGEFRLAIGVWTARAEQPLTVLVDTVWLERPAR